MAARVSLLRVSILPCPRMPVSFQHPRWQQRQQLFAVCRWVHTNSWTLLLTTYPGHTDTATNARQPFLDILSKFVGYSTFKHYDILYNFCLGYYEYNRFVARQDRDWSIELPKTLGEVHASQDTHAQGTRRRVRREVHSSY